MRALNLLFAASVAALALLAAGCAAVPEQPVVPGGPAPADMVAAIRADRATKPPAAPDGALEPLDKETVRRALHEVMDPELGVPITDLGLIYDIRMDDDRVLVVMTTTTPICPLGSYIRQEIDRKLGGHTVDVELVHEPLWSPEMMNEAARRTLGWDR